MYICDTICDTCTYVTLQLRSGIDVRTVRLLCYNYIRGIQRLLKYLFGEADVASNFLLLEDS